MVGRNPAGHVVGLGSRAVRDLYVNGEPQPVGYMSHLRVDPGFGWGAALPSVLGRGWRFYRELHQDGRTPYYLLSLVEGEHAAPRMLRAGLRDWPRLTPVGHLTTYSVVARRTRVPVLPKGVSLRRGTRADLPAIAACLDRSGRRRTFSPVWRAEELCHPDFTPGLAAEHFWLAEREGVVMGCVARWDQQPWKQTIVLGYAPRLRRLRPWVNLAAQIGLAPPLPQVGATIRHSFASHWAADGDDVEVAAALFAAVLNDAAGAGDDYLMVGLDPAHDFTAVLKAHRHVPYRTALYLATWDGEVYLPGRVNQVGAEIAVL
jgi:hypothetical protein